MAENLARIYGTEEDKVNCPFYFKIGACRHGDRCSRTHNRPLFSQTLLIPHMYTLPPVNPLTGLPTVNEKEHLTEFCEEVIDELQNFGALEEFHVVGNLGEHMLGNVYLKYSREEEAEKALKALTGRFYGGRQLTVEYSPVSDFRESRCRQYDEETCNRGGFCNFMHMRPLPSVIRKELEYIREKNRRRAERHRERHRSRSRERSDRDYGRSHGSHRDGDRDRERHGGHSSSSRDRAPALPAAAAASASASAPGGGDRRDRERSPRREGDRDRHRSSREERPSGSNSSSSSGGAGGERVERSASEERRAKIAEWNKAREAKIAAEAAAATGGAGGEAQQQQQQPPPQPKQEQY